MAGGGSSNWPSRIRLKAGQVIRYHLWDGGSEAFGQMPRARDSFQVDLTGFLLKLGSAGPARMGAKVSLGEGSAEPE